MTQVEHPYIRDEVIDAVRELADREHQQVVWPDPRYFQFLDEALEWLSGTTRLLDEPELAVGRVLRDAEEVRVFHVLDDALDTLFAQLGTGLAEEQYVASPSWDQVVDAARGALAVLEAGRTQVRFPARRSSIAYEVCALSSREHQAEVWPHPDRGDDLGEAVRVLLDETGVLRHPDATVGRYLRDATEARAMGALGTALRAVLDEVGPVDEHPAEAYTSSPRWAAVIDAATTAHAALQAP